MTNKKAGPRQRSQKPAARKAPIKDMEARGRGKNVKAGSISLNYSKQAQDYKQQ